MYVIQKNIFVSEMMEFIAGKIRIDILTFSVIQHYFSFQEVTK